MLEIISNQYRVKNDKTKKTYTYVICRCHCGVEKPIRKDMAKVYKSCGCQRKFRSGNKPYNYILIPDDELIKMYHEYDSYSKIATILNVCRKTVQNKLKTLGYSGNKNIGRNGSKNPKYNGYKEILGSFFARIKREAKIRQLEFNITIEYVWELFLTQDRKCRYSGLELYFAKTADGYQHGECTASLDRIDSAKGYIVGNVQWVHKYINLMKLDFTEEEFLYWCKIITDYNNNKISGHKHG